MKPLILSRYVLKAWLGYLLGALLLFGGLLLVHETVNLTKGLLAERASFKWLPVFLTLAVPEVLGLVLPMSAIFAGLLGTRDLAQGSELVAAQGLGTGSRVFYKPWLAMSAGLVLLASLNSHLLIPASYQVQARLRTQLAEEAKQRFLRPGAPPIPLQGEPAQAIWTSPQGQVHILEVNAKGVQHLVSDRVSWTWEALDSERSMLSLRLDEVSGSYIPRDGSSAAQLRQAVQTVAFPIKISTGKSTSTHFRDASSIRLWGLAGPEPRAELARRISLPLLAASLLLMGIGLGYGHPRFLGGSGLIGGLGVMVVYYVLYRSLESRLLAGNDLMFYFILLLPIGLAILAWYNLSARMKPHRSWSLPSWMDLSRLRKAASLLDAPDLRVPSGPSMGPARQGILGSWSRRLWWRSWGGVLATLLLLHLLIEYSSVAGDFSASHRSLWEFFAYWFWRLPSFLTIALPISFMLGTVFALSTATLSNEWVALRTGGVSLGQWIWRARGAWLSVLALTLFIQHFAIPAGEVRVRAIQQRLFKRPVRPSDASTWQYLGSTGVLWYMEPGVRWGFPLKSPGEAPALLVWRPGDGHSQGLPWDGFGLRQGPETGRLFPDASLMGTPVVEENSTLDLMRWQRWAYEPTRATHLWARFLGWLAGPCLVLAVLPRAFPNPRAGRGSALAFSLIGGLLFLGLQLLFNGAAQAGEIPAVWGVLGPLLLAAAAGATQLRHLRT